MALKQGGHSFNCSRYKIALICTGISDLNLHLSDALKGTKPQSRRETSCTTSITFVQHKYKLKILTISISIPSNISKTSIQSKVSLVSTHSLKYDMIRYGSQQRNGLIGFNGLKKKEKKEKHCLHITECLGTGGWTAEESELFFLYQAQW